MDQHIKGEDGNIIRLSPIVDDVSLRNMRVVHMSDKAAAEKIRKRIMAPILAKQKAEEDAAAELAAQEAKVLALYNVAKTKRSKNQKLLVDEIHAAITVESKACTGPDSSVDGDCKCSFCPIWYAVLKKWASSRSNWKEWMSCGTDEACHWCFQKLKQKRHTSTCTDCQSAGQQ